MEIEELLTLAEDIRNTYKEDEKYEDLCTLLELLYNMTQQEISNTLKFIESAKFYDLSN